MTDPISKETTDSIRSQHPQKSIRQIAKELGLSRSEVRQVLFPDSEQIAAAEVLPVTIARYNISSLQGFVILFAAVFIIYWNSLGNEFVWDDISLIVNNPTIKSLGLAASSFLRPLGEGTFSYRPVQIFCYALEHRLFGLNPIGFHMGSIFLHGTASFLVFVFFRSFTKNHTWALATSLLFAVHPLHTGAVTYLSGQDNMIALVFILLCLVTHHAAGSSLGVLRALSFTAFAFALLSKEVAMFTLPAIVLYDRVIGKKEWRQLFRQVHYYVYAALLLGYLFLRLTATSSVTDEPLDRFVSQKNVLLVTPAVILTYLRLFFWPHPLYLAHYFPLPRGFFDSPVFLSFVGLVLVCALGWRLARKSHWVTFGLGWFVLWFLPFSNLFKLLNALLAEHWMYVPSIGFIFAAVCTTDLYLKSKKVKQALFLFFVLIFGGLTFRQNFFWKNEEILFSYTVKRAPHSARVWNNLGIVHEKKGQLEKARACYEKAATLMPGFLEAEENYRRMGGVVTPK